MAGTQQVIKIRNADLTPVQIIGVLIFINLYRQRQNVQSQLVGKLLGQITGRIRKQHIFGHLAKLLYNIGNIQSPSCFMP